MSTTSFGTSLTQPTETQGSPLGAIRHTDDHQTEWVYIENATGAEIPAKAVVISAQTASKHRARVESAGAAGALKSKVLGVAVTAIPAGYFGWIQRKGTVVVDSSTAVTANHAALCANSGKVQSIASGSITAADIAEVIGHVVVGNSGAAECTIWLDL